MGAITDKIREHAQQDRRGRQRERGHRAEDERARERGRERERDRGEQVYMITK